MPDSNNNAKASIDKWVTAEVRAMKAYRVPSSTGLIKLDAMENPYTLPATLKQEWLSVLGGVSVNRYPDPDSTELKALIRSCFSIPDECGLMLGNGSDELIQIIAMLVGGVGRTFLAPVPTFSMYQQISVATATQFAGIPLTADFSIKAENLFEAMEEFSPACIFFAYPNNPIGNCFDPTTIKQVINSAPGLVVVDEAYFAFCQKSFINEIAAHPNLIVLRTMSKSGLAGLRLGLMLGNPEWIEQMEKLRLPYNNNILSQASAQFYLQHHDILQQQAGQIRKDRSWVFQEMSKISGIEVFPSEANFLLFRVERSADEVFNGLREKGVLIRNLHNPSSPLENCLRVTIGLEQENRVFIAALSSLLFL
ncbi:histidinol-phosphate transaminase [Candidatus Spongiihabitans sp.]|uniref:histidinol-phosphate transaminase n=1 Tax=Candidatus Spongiihabitans sp. TaxID=3101308 RepID=UPI003C6FE76C